MTDPIPEGVRIVRFAGELDLGRKEELRATFDAVPSDDPVIVDLAQVRYLDSVALTELIRFRRTHATLALVVVHDHLKRLLRISGLDTYFAVHPSLAEASEALIRPSRR